MLYRVLLASRGGVLTITNVNATVNATVIINAVNTTVNDAVLIFSSPSSTLTHFTTCHVFTLHVITPHVITLHVFTLHVFTAHVFTAHVFTPFDSRSWYARQLLPRSLASLQVEGGCPYSPYPPLLR